MARLLLKGCIVGLLTVTFSMVSQGTTHYWYRSTRTSPYAFIKALTTTTAITTPAPAFTAAPAAVACPFCPACPSGYTSRNVSVTIGYGCPRCLCEWSGQSSTTGNYPVTTTDFSQNLLMKILLNLGHNADAVNMMASSLDEEAQIAGDVAKHG